MADDWNNAPENTYSYNGGVLAFKFEGFIYATPFYEEAERSLKACGYVEGNYGVPFNGLTSFPGYLDHDRLINYYNQVGYEGVVAYYQRLSWEENFQDWDKMVKKKNMQRHGIVEGPTDIIRRQLEWLKSYDSKKRFENSSTSSFKL